MDHAANSGFDIKNLADPGANTFEGNVCDTSVNAPCPSVGPSLTANPNPIPVTGNARYGSTTLSWNAPDAQFVEVHIGSPNGPLFTLQGSRGSAQTALWVSDGMTFYLQDVTGGKPLTSDHTLATLVVHLQSSSAASFHFRDEFQRPALLLSTALTGLVLCALFLAPPAPKRRGARIGLGGAVLLAVTVFASQTMAQAQQTTATLERMVKDNRPPQDLAQYVFDTQGCGNCHTKGDNGKLGFTAKGKEKAQGFEGCINMLTAMTVIVQVPEDKRSPQQRQKAARFGEFGCTACHQLTPGRLGLTDVGTKLAHLHLGCVDVQKLTSMRRGPRN